MTAQQRKKLTRAAVIGGALVVIVAVWSLLSLSGASDAAPAGDGAVGGVEWYTVRPTSFDITITASGELEARNQIEIKSRVDGSTAIISVIDEGERVEAGDLLAKLDDKEIINEIDEETLQVEQARASLIAAERDLQLAEQDAANALKQAQVKLDMARLSLEKWHNGDVIQRRRELDLALIRAERELETAARDLELSKQLRAENFISQNEMDESELDHITAIEGLETAKQNIEVYNKYTHKQEMQQKQSDVEQAEADLERTRKENEIRLDRQRSEVESKRRTLELREQRLAEAQQQLENTVIRAPSAGLVVYATSVGGGRRGNDDPIQQGRQVRRDETVFLLPDTSQMVAALRVHEAMMSQIEIGQSAAIAIDARRGESASGKVISVGVMAADGGWFNPQLREYTVKVALPENYDTSLKPAMRCTGDIFVGRVEDALAVPIQAVATEGERRYVYLPAGGRVRRQPVRIGRASETLVEVVDGLESGDRVLLRNPAPGEVVNERGGSAAGPETTEQQQPQLQPDTPAGPASPMQGERPRDTRPPMQGDGERPQPRDGQWRRPGGDGQGPRPAGDGERPRRDRQRDAQPQPRDGEAGDQPQGDPSDAESQQPAPAEGQTSTQPQQPGASTPAQQQN